MHSVHCQTALARGPDWRWAVTAPRASTSATVVWLTGYESHCRAAAPQRRRPAVAAFDADGAQRATRPPQQRPSSATPDSSEQQAAAASPLPAGPPRLPRRRRAAPRAGGGAAPPWPPAQPGRRPVSALLRAALRAAAGALGKDEDSGNHPNPDVEAPATQLLQQLFGGGGGGGGSGGEDGVFAARAGRLRALVATGVPAPLAAAAAAAALAAADAAGGSGRGVTAVHLFPSAAALLAARPASEAAAAAAAPAAAAAAGLSAPRAGLQPPAGLATLEVHMWVGGGGYTAERAAARDAPPHLLLATPGRLAQHLADPEVQWGPVLRALRLVVVHDADAFLRPGGNLRWAGLRRAGQGQRDGGRAASGGGESARVHAQAFAPRGRGGGRLLLRGAAPF
jgi:hypothetical protein